MSTTVVEVDPGPLLAAVPLELTRPEGLAVLSADKPMKDTLEELRDLDTQTLLYVRQTLAFGASLGSLSLEDSPKNTNEKINALEEPVRSDMRTLMVGLVLTRHATALKAACFGTEDRITVPPAVALPGVIGTETLSRLARERREEGRQLTLDPAGSGNYLIVPRQ
ncbi:MAG TPA: hypothetical protein VJ836_07740 [Candidatus Saccharimonadales bacterium]|nr:hypothetical protein [Candidatus Saccharimonadales bacterium]